MFDAIRRRRQSRRMAAILYGAIVAQARHPAFFIGYGVPDTVDGRFEMVIVHMFLALRTLERGDGDSRASGQATFDLFCRDMDRALREMGIGDLAVPRRMRRVGEAYYGRAQAYERAVEASDHAALAAALSRNVASGAEVATSDLATYMMCADRALAATAQGELHAGTLPFPDPSGFLSTENTP